MTAANRNESEILFEEYLTAHGHNEWTHESPVEGKRKNPDYRLEYGGSSYFFEVKEFDAPMPPMGGGKYDPYGPIREKINQSRSILRHHGIRAFRDGLLNDAIRNGSLEPFEQMSTVNSAGHSF